MNILALIPARSGSKRVANKNKRILGSKPLISWTIDLALSVPEISSICISTDDPEIVEIATSSGLNVPWLRPQELSDDKSSLVDVAIHALNQSIRDGVVVDGLLLLQPTSPFRSLNAVTRAIDIFRENRSHPVIGFSASQTHPMWTFNKSGNYLTPLSKIGLGMRSQDLPESYYVNGSLYLVSPDFLMKNNSFFDAKNVPIIEEGLVIDIDTELDFLFAEFLLANGKS